MVQWCRAHSLLELQGLFPAPLAQAVNVPAIAQHGPPKVAARLAPNLSYLIRHWRGELWLPVSYWINGVLADISFEAVVFALSVTNLADSLGMRATGCYTLGVLLSVSAVTIGSSIGIRRSASQRSERGGTRGWAETAKVLASIAIIRLALVMLAHSPLISQSFTLASGRDTLTPSMLQATERGKPVEVAGELSFGTADALHTILDERRRSKSWN